ncbi:MAG: hypothetical protein FWG25_10725, partial [Promicromonosporaceae bacterium]|nr:hypothetical protein [Promicromonosporaceae bacterium]
EGGPWMDLATLALWDIQLAVWSVPFPADVQWLNPVSINEGVVEFLVLPPPDGWVGDVVAGHFFMDGEFLFQQIWRVP